MKREQQLHLNVLTLNVWGLWLVAKRRAERVTALADFLQSAACTAGVVLLQKAWVVANVELLRQAAAEGRLPHSIHFLSGAIGSGLLVLSRHRISQVPFHPFTARGDPAAVFCGDYYAGKGTISIFNTHLSANYGQQWQTGAQGLSGNTRLPQDGLAGVRLLQVLELAAFVRSHSRGSIATVLAGDLNAAPDMLEIGLFKALLPYLRDAWAIAQPLRMGATADALESSFTTVGAGHSPSRIDYILSSGHAVNAKLALTDTGGGCSCPDYVGVLATLAFGGAAGSGGGSMDDDAGITFSGSGGRGGGMGLPLEQPPLPRCAALLTLGEQMRRWPEPFQHVATAIEQAALDMAHGQQCFLRLAALLWAAGLGCFGAPVARPWWPERLAAEAQYHQLTLLGGMGTALGWAGVLFVGGFVARGGKLRALQQVACQLQLTFGLEAVQGCQLSPSRYLTCLRELAAAPDCD